MAFFSRRKDCNVAFKSSRHSRLLKDPYSKSNSIKLEFRPNDEILEALKLFKEAVMIGAEDLILRAGQHLLDDLNLAFGIDKDVTLNLRGNRPSRKKVDPETGKKRIVASTHGKYYPERRLLAIYTSTATGRKVAYKTLLNTLIHEFCHHMDYYHPSLSLHRSLHTKGFYERLNAIYNPLKDF